jgi:hypothetical protein
MSNLSDFDCLSECRMPVYKRAREAKRRCCCVEGSLIRNAWVAMWRRHCRSSCAVGFPDIANSFVATERLREWANFFEKSDIRLECCVSLARGAIAESIGLLWCPFKSKHLLPGKWPSHISWLKRKVPKRAPCIVVTFLHLASSSWARRL